MAKALSLSGLMNWLIVMEKKRLEKELALELLNKQDPSGLWINENGRWWSADPVLVTSYALLH